MAAGAGVFANVPAPGQSGVPTLPTAPTYTEIWYGSQRITPPRLVEKAEPAPTLAPAAILHPPKRPTEETQPPLAPLPEPSNPPRRLPATPKDNPLRTLPGPGAALDAQPPEAWLPGPAEPSSIETPSVAHALPLTNSPVAKSPVGVEQVHAASLWQGVGAPSGVTPAVIADSAMSDAENHTPNHATERIVHPSPVDQEPSPESRPLPHDAGDATGWQRWTVGAGLFLSGAVLGPLIVALTLVRFLRRNPGPLFRIEIVGAPGASASVTRLRDAPPNADLTPSELAESEAPTRRGAVSLEPPPFELPPEDTFVLRRRREQDQQRQREEQILEQLFEENLELRRQMEQPEADDRG